MEASLASLQTLIERILRNREWGQVDGGRCLAALLLSRPSFPLPNTSERGQSEDATALRVQATGRSPLVPVSGGIGCETVPELRSGQW